MNLKKNNTSQFEKVKKQKETPGKKDKMVFGKKGKKRKRKDEGKKG